MSASSSTRSTKRLRKRSRRGVHAMRSAFELTWERVSFDQAWLARGNRSLIIQIGPSPRDGKWTALGIETAAALVGESPLTTVLDDHAHTVIAEGVSRRRAYDACRRFARAWLAGLTKPIACTCGEVGAVDKAAVDKADQVSKVDIAAEVPRSAW